MKILYYPVFVSWYLLSLLPLRLLYLFSDLLYFPVYYVLRYRRGIVRSNLTSSFPEKSKREIVEIEKRFYHFFCDYVVETIKIFSMSKEQMRRRMTFEGTDEMVQAMKESGKTLTFVYLGHYGNWEWIASLPYWVPEEVLCGQIYHPLRNKAFDSLFLRLRNRFGGECVAMKITLRRMIEMKRSGRPTIIGFISDQLPKWSSIHHFSPFFHRPTAVFTGTEQMGKKLDTLFYYAEVTRPRRGYYHCHFKPLCEHPAQQPDFALTDLYTARLEEMIRQTPHLWLWSHNRWKRTKEEYDRRNAANQK
jgi:KDO2-lipid IV(A) lauroyltransferase